MKLAQVPPQAIGPSPLPCSHPVAWCTASSLPHDSHLKADEDGWQALDKKSVGLKSSVLRSLLAVGRGVGQAHL